MSDQAILVLLIEDSVDDAKFIIDTLQAIEPALRIQHAVDGPAALDFLFGTGVYVDRPLDVLPRLILLDLWLPKVNGLEVLRIVKSYMRTQVIPIVVLT